MLFVGRPHYLSDEEADRWMREQAAPLASVSSVAGVELTRIKTPAARGGTGWQWLIEMHCKDGEQAERAAGDHACRDLMADLRLLGMAPSLVVADGTESLEG